MAGKRFKGKADFCWPKQEPYSKPGDFKEPRGNPKCGQALHTSYRCILLPFIQVPSEMYLAVLWQKGMQVSYNYCLPVTSNKGVSASGCKPAFSACPSVAAWRRGREEDGQVVTHKQELRPSLLAGSGKGPGPR